MSVHCTTSLVLFDLDGTLVGHDGAAAKAVERSLMDRGWAEAGSLPDLVKDWDAVAERHGAPFRTRPPAWRLCGR